MDELFSLLWIKHHHEEGEFDCVIVDCAPTGETLRLLSFPDVVTWWLERILPSQRRLAPFARTLFDIPLPGEAVFEDVEKLARNLVAMNGILRDRSRTSIRLVTSPDRMVVKESMRTFTYLNLYGYLTDAVVVNRLLPADGYFAAWRRSQEEQLELVRSAFAPVPVLTADYSRARSSTARTRPPSSTTGSRRSSSPTTAPRPCAWTCPSPSAAT
jgi:arsenite-transporting ATPase